MTPQAARTVATALRRARSAPCLLCGKAAAAAGLWIPTPSASRRLGAPAGKIRLTTYSVCRAHARREYATAVEDVLIAEARRDLARPDSN